MKKLLSLVRSSSFLFFLIPRDFESSLSLLLPFFLPLFHFSGLYPSFRPSTAESLPVKKAA